MNYGISKLKVKLNTKEIITPTINGIPSTISISPSLPSDCKFNNQTGTIELLSAVELDEEYTITAIDHFESKLSVKVEIIFTEVVEDIQAIKYLQLGYYSFYLFVKDVEYSIPIYFVGIADSCDVSPDLPEGLLFDKSGIHGKTSIEYDNKIVTYSFVCKNSKSETNIIKFDSIVLDKLESGLIGNYWKWNTEEEEFDCINVIDFFKNKNVEIFYRRIDKSLNHEIVNSSTLWSSELSNEFHEYYGITWTGYLNIPSTSKYRFKVNADDGVRVILNDKSIIAMSGCNNDYNNDQYSEEMDLIEGYMKIEIAYYQSDNFHGFKLEWKKEDNDYEDISSQLYHSPGTMLSYEYTRVTYDNNFEMISNKPILNGITIPNGNVYTIAPELNNGLLFDENTGIIYGNISLSDENTEYNSIHRITIKSDLGIVNCHVYIYIKDCDIPYGIQLTYSTSDELILDRHITILKNSFISFSLSANLINESMIEPWYISPSYPVIGKNQIDLQTPQLTLYSDGVINGTCTVSESSTVEYIVRGRNNNGEVVKSFELECLSSCPSNSYQVSVYLSRSYYNNYLYRIKDSSNTTIFEMGTDISETMYFCAKPNEIYTFGVYCKTTIGGSTSYKIKIFNQISVIEGYIYFGKEYTNKTFEIQDIYKCQEFEGFKSVNAFQKSYKKCEGENILGNYERECIYDSTTGVTYWNTVIVDNCRVKLPITMIDYGISEITVPIGRNMSFKPNIVYGDIDNVIINPSNDKVKINIENGLLLTLYSSEIVNMIEYTFTFSNSLPSEQSIKIKISFANSAIVDVVHSLNLGISDSYQFVKNVPVKIPLFITGKATNCIFSGLPDGFIFDNNNNNINEYKITGIPTEVSNTISEATIYCENEISKTNIISFKYEIHEKPLEGINGIYWTMDQFDCGTRIDPDVNNDAIMKIIKLDNTTLYKSSDYSYSSQNKPWPGLTNEFVNNYGVHWDGYLNFNETGSYKIGGKAGQYFWLFLEDDLVISSSSCDSYSTASFTYNVNNVGYKKIDIYYQHTSNGKFIELQWTTPSNSYFDYIPNDYYYYLPHTLFFYPIKLLTAYINQPINTISPILYDIETPISYSIEPPMNNGLYFDRLSGNISGTPTFNTGGERVRYTITIITATNTTIYTYFYIRITNYMAPYNLQLVYPGTNKLISNILIKNGNSISLEYRAYGEVEDSSIEPKYKDLSLSYSSSSYIYEKREVYGTCYSDNEQLYTITSKNNAGSSVYTFNYKCISKCDKDDEIIFDVYFEDYTVFDGKFDFEIINSETNITLLEMNNVPQFTKKPQWIMCLNAGINYRIKGITTLKKEVNFKIEYSTYSKNTVTIPATSSSEGEETHYNVDFSVKIDPPSVSYYSPSKVVEVGSYLSMYATTSGLVTRCRTDPVLFPGLSISGGCDISGKSNVDRKSTNFTVIAGNEFGEGEGYIITIEISGCNSKGGVSIEWELDYSYSFSFYSTFEIVDDKDNAIISEYLYGGDDGSFCIPVGNYTLVITDYTEEGWIDYDEKLYLTFSKDNKVIGKYTFSDDILDEERIAISFTSVGLIPINQLFYYSLNKPIEDWYKSGVNVLNWKSDIQYNLPAIENGSIYIKTKFVIPFSDLDISLVLTFQHEYGCIVYFNDKEIYSKFIVDNNNTIYANGSFEKETKVTLIMPLELIELGLENTLSFELRMIEGGNPWFNLAVEGDMVETSSECYDIINSNIKDIVVSSDSVIDKDKNNLKDLFDEKQSTSVTFNTDNANCAILYFGFSNINFAMNTFEISITNIDKAPYGYLLEYILDNNNNNSNILSNQTNITSSIINNQFKDIIKTHYLYSQYKLTLYSKEPNKEIQLSDISVKSCLYSYCPVDPIYGTILSGSCINNLPCKAYYSGNAKLCCSSVINNRNAKWDDINYDECYINPVKNFSYSHNSYELLIDKEFSTKPSVEGIELSFSYTPSNSLPNGLFLNKETGEIYGIAKEKKSVKISVSVTNPAKEILYFELNITVIELACKNEGSWKVTSPGNTLTVSCVDGYIGSRNRTCLRTDPPSWSEIDESGCLKDDRDPNYPKADEVYIISDIKLSNIDKNKVKISILKDDIRQILINPTLKEDKILLFEKEDGNNNKESIKLNIVVIGNKLSSNELYNYVNNSLNTIEENLPKLNNELYDNNIKCEIIDINKIEYINPPISLSYNKIILIWYLNYEIEALIPTVMGTNSYSFRIDNSTKLPNDIQLNTESGIISGIPREIKSNIVKVCVYNRNGEFCIELHYEIKEYSCPNNRWWPETKINEIISINCFDGMIGKQYRSCLYNNNTKSSEWSDIDRSKCERNDISPNPNVDEIILNYFIRIAGLNLNDGDVKDDFRFVISNYVNLSVSNIFIKEENNDNLYRIEIKCKSEESGFKTQFYNALADGIIQQNMKNIKDEYYSFEINDLKYEEKHYNKDESKNKIIVIIGSICGVVGFIAIVIIFLFFYFRCLSRKNLNKRKYQIPQSIKV